jgi:hypothetical protein
MSNASKIVAKRDSETRATYMASLVAQVCTGVIEEINSKELDWGKQHEDAARAAYEFLAQVKIQQVSFVFSDETHRVGCSPDGFPVGMKRGSEIKCPWNSANYIKFLVAEKIKSEWEWQCQGGMWVTGAESWDMSMFDPRMKTKPFHSIEIERDEKKQATLSDAIPQFIYDMDQVLEQIGVKFGDHWLAIAENQKRESA